MVCNSPFLNALPNQFYVVFFDVYVSLPPHILITYRVHVVTFSNMKGKVSVENEMSFCMFLHMIMLVKFSQFVKASQTYIDPHRNQVI